MLLRGGKYYQRRWQIDSSGKPINVDEKQVDFVMGSGDHVRTYLHRTAAGALQELPLAWYSERGGTWGMNPGYDTAVQPNSRRKVSYECMFCHNAYPDVPGGHEQLRAEPIFAGSIAAIPQGIDCQRCHGPGQRHVELARTPHPSTEAIRASIVNPARLNADRQMEVCAQCHLETDSFPFPHSILKYDRKQFSFKPGEPLSDFMLFFDHAVSPKADDRFQIVNSVYRLRMSACFVKSNSKLKCTTCHDPHDANRTAASYNGICRQCHGTLDAKVQLHRGSPDCIACHMPKRRTDDVVRAVMTDHYIQRRKPDRDLLAEFPEPHGSGIVYRGNVVPYELTPHPLSSPQEELYLAVAQVREGNNSERGIEQLSAAIRKYQPKPAEFYIELGDAFVKAGKPAAAISLYKEALLRDPGSLDAELGLGGAYEKSGDLAHAIEAYSRATQLSALNANAWRQLGEVRTKLRQSAEAAAALRKSIELDPDVPEAHYALAIVLADQLGDRSAAETSYREAIRLQPDYAAAHGNLAILLFRENRTAESRDHFERALRYHPEYALGHYNFALILIAQGKKDEAIRQLEFSLQTSSISVSAPGFTLDPLVRETAEKRLKELREAH